MKISIKVPEKFKFLFNLILKISPFGIGMFCLGSVTASLLSKQNMVALVKFMPVDIITEAHRQWFCSNRVSYTSDFIILSLAMLFLFVFMLEVKPE
jgi:hypothetical protein